MRALRLLRCLHCEEFENSVRYRNHSRSCEAGKGGGRSPRFARSRLGNRKLCKFQDTRESAHALARQSARAHVGESEGAIITEFTCHAVASGT